MGERGKQQVEVTFAPGAGEAVGKFLVELLERFATVRHPEPAPEPPAGPAVVPWRFYSPHAKCEVDAYLDDHRQVRHVPLTRTSDVPKHWQRLYVPAEE